MPAGGDQHVALEGAHHDAILVEALGDDGHNALAGARGALTFGQHFAFGIKRITSKDGCRELHFIHTQIGDRLLAGVGHAHADAECQRIGRDDEVLLELARGSKLRVKMHRVGVHRHQREHVVVIFGDGLAGAVFIDITDDEVLKIATKCLAVALGANFFHVTDHS